MFLSKSKGVKSLLWIIALFSPCVVPTFMINVRVFAATAGPTDERGER